MNLFTFCLTVNADMRKDKSTNPRVPEARVFLVKRSSGIMI